ncbi:MAG: hypothetical protein Q8Q88_13320 [Phenylobacterium sp.]|uniref:DUF4870 family protein n=1 Tax=Phenylobacterium sp. TaxID=1871053 RepID=UPI002737467D|nr:hypothetical protein [Phenylobacterium sp.]MDP3748016.1 hypothetical protein [Phenylobacterium sp.]
MSHTETTVSTTEDRTLPAVVYGLYLLGLVNGLTIIIGLVIAYASRESAGPKMASHYQFQIRTFWLALVASIVLGVMTGVGVVLSFILIGIPILLLAGLLWCVLGIWFAVRCIVGLIHLSNGDGHPRPEALLA